MNCPRALPLKILLPSYVRILLPSQKKYGLTGFLIGIIKALSIMLKIFVSIVITAKRLTPVEKLFFATLNVLPALPVIKHAKISKRNAVPVLTKPPKGKIKTVLTYKGKKHDAYLSHVKVQITASKKDIYLVLVYGITEHPMMLATNKKIQSREDVVNIALTYFSRWRIEEYFRCKKQMFQFENFRVRKLAAINALNFYITLCMAFLAHISMKSETNALKVSIIQKADPVKEKVHFCYYRLAKGISGILSYAKEGVRLWFRTKRPAYRQLCLKLIA